MREEREGKKSESERRTAIAALGIWFGMQNRKLFRTLSEVDFLSPYKKYSIFHRR
jgi:hypothetical protein